MVGHTGDLAAAIKACEAVDRGLARVVEALEKAGGAMVLTADHGNCETMVDPETGGPHTAHTTNLVPVALFGGPEGVTLADGRLADLAPTLLDLMELEQPDEMTGAEPDPAMKRLRCLCHFCVLPFPAVAETATEAATLLPFRSGLAA